MEYYTDINKDLQIIEDFFVIDEDYDNSLKDMCRKMDISSEEYLKIKKGEIEPSKTQLEGIYNFAYTKGLFLNEITWQECLDEYRKEKVKVCTHGARTYIKGDIRLDANGLGTEERAQIANYKGGESNDFANGFYLGQDLSQACMFVGEEPNSSLYILTFQPKGLKCAYFDVGEDWMLAVSLFRNKLTEYENHPRLIEIKRKVENCDFVFAPIADNKIFEVIDAFTSGEITNLQCLYALSATHLGYQYVLKSQKALDRLNIIKHLYYCGLEKSIYNKESDVETNTSYNKAVIAKKKYRNQGQYISEILQPK